MGQLNLTGKLDLVGALALKDKVLVNGVEALVVAAKGAAPAVMLPPPSPVDTGTDVAVVASFNQTVTAGGQAIVTQGVTLQGNGQIWPGMLLPSSGNQTVTANGSPINVVGDKGITLPSGGQSVFTKSGQD
ncbi:hypothetical protein [Kutzneria sp. NPDC052558]|uniref:hypothetical protein n=1 Tax=Kutzneria sp. NPDC052558 TaxID=3364121 RepID=UPI0037C639D2